jgi:hypothetical protein
MGEQYIEPTIYRNLTARKTMHYIAKKNPEEPNNLKEVTL